ncbi:MAG: hypothetical protein DHS80DRAFT_23730 [Piptocephalis tieghemiana]|nr:MAG: hypothetical protein DHS80DRAFT_23730 [Piptocephalis tieghemiana]
MSSSPDKDRVNTLTPPKVVETLKKNGTFDAWRKQAYAHFHHSTLGRELQEDMEVMVQAHILADPSLKTLNAKDFQSAIQDRLSLEGVFDRLARLAQDYFQSLDHQEEEGEEGAKNQPIPPIKPGPLPPPSIGPSVWALVEGREDVTSEQQHHYRDQQAKEQEQPPSQEASRGGSPPSQSLMADHVHQDCEDE